MLKGNIGWRRAVRFAAGWGMGILLSLGCGCVQTNISQPKRTAVEQLLLSRAADNALSRLDLSTLNGKKVYFEEKYIDAQDELYVMSSIRDLISYSGGRLVEKAEEADVIVEGRTGALSIDSGESLVGFPEMPVPIPLSGTFVSPEVPFYKSERQFSVAKIALYAYEAESREHRFSTGPLLGKSHHHYYKLLGFIRWIRTDLPSKKSNYTMD